MTDQQTPDQTPAPAVDQSGTPAPEHDVPPVTTAGEDATSSPEPINTDGAPSHSETPTDTETPDDGADDQGEQDAGTTGEDSTGPDGEEDQEADDDEEDTPEPHADPRVRKARAEAVKYRHRAREAETALTTVTAERDALQARLDGIEHDRMATDACRAAHLPEAMASHLTGTTADQLTEDAQRISAAMGYDRGPVDPSQGRGGGEAAGTGPDGAYTWADAIGTGNNDL